MWTCLGARKRSLEYYTYVYLGIFALELPNHSDQIKTRDGLCNSVQKKKEVRDITKNKLKNAHITWSQNHTNDDKPSLSPSVRHTS